MLLRHLKVFGIAACFAAAPRTAAQYAGADVAGHTARAYAALERDESGSAATRAWFGLQRRMLGVLGKPVLPVPLTLFRTLLAGAWRFRLASFPAAELDHIRFSSVLDVSRARAELKVEPERTLYDCLEPFAAYTAEHSPAP